MPFAGSGTWRLPACAVQNKNACRAGCVPYALTSVYPGSSIPCGWEQARILELKVRVSRFHDRSCAGTRTQEPTLKARASPSLAIIGGLDDQQRLTCREPSVTWPDAGVRRVPVVGLRGQLTAIVSLDDVVEAFAAQFRGPCRSHPRRTAARASNPD